jgi:mono/diheme cytochrome c family protein
MRAPVVALLALAFLVTGCAEGNGRGAGPPTTSPEATFVRSCGACHTLAAAGTHGTAGEDLDALRPTSDAVLRAIEDGPGAMQADLVHGREAKLVARYVAREAGG